MPAAYMHVGVLMCDVCDDDNKLIPDFFRP